MLNKLTEVAAAPRPILKTMAVVADAATLGAPFDWLMEPVAIRLGYWKWGGDGSIPLFNYACWFIVSLLLLLVFNNAGSDKRKLYICY